MSIHNIVLIIERRGMDTGFIKNIKETADNTLKGTMYFPLKKVVIFDFDYTLGDSSRGIILSINYALGKMGYEKAREDKIIKTIGMSLAETYKKLTNRNNQEEIKTFEVYFKEKADEVMVSNTCLYSGVTKLLDSLHNKGLKTAIATTKYHYRINQILKAKNAYHLVDYIAGGEDVTLPKPSPEGIYKIKENFHVKPKEILYVGDSIVDAETAKAAGTDFIAVLTGVTEPKEFKKYPYVHILNHVTELVI